MTESAKSTRARAPRESPGPRVLVCGLDFHGKVNGGVTNATALVSALAERVEHIYLATFWLIGFGRPKVAIRNFNVKAFSVPIVEGLWPIHAVVLLAYSMLFLLLLSILKAFGKVDVVFVSDTLLAYGMLQFKRFHSVPVVVRYTSLEEIDSNRAIRSSTLREAMTKLLYKVDGLALSSADAVIAQSFYFAEVLEARHKGASRAKVLVVPPVIDLTTKPKLALAPQREGEEVRVGYVGSFLPYQGVDILIRAMVGVQRRIPTAVLYLIGGDGFRSPRYGNLAERLGVKVVFTGPLEHRETLDLLRTFECLVAPRRRNFATELLIPMKMLEAFSLGIPVIITGHRGLMGFLEDGVQVRFVEPTPGDVSSAILEVLLDRRLHDRLSSNGTKVARLFDARKNAIRLSALLREVSASREASSS